ncbi:nucleosome assembly protein [Tanacetum coccineum]
MLGMLYHCLTNVSGPLSTTIVTHNAATLTEHDKYSSAPIIHEQVQTIRPDECPQLKTTFINSVEHLMINTTYKENTVNNGRWSKQSVFFMPGGVRLYVRVATIKWLPGKCLTQKILKNKPKNGSKNAKPITKTEDCESFFNFFNTTQVPEDEDDIDKEENFRIKWSKPMPLEEDDDDDDDDEEIDDEDEEDANDDDEEEDDEDEEEGKSKRKTKPFTRKRGGVPSTGTGGEERSPERKEQ